MTAEIAATFTPSVMSPETLEAIFVQRQDLAARLVEDIRASATSRTKHHHLLVGPRGIGKTHLVSIVRHRVARLPKLRDRLVVAWMREDEWGVTSYLDLLVRIHADLLETTQMGAVAEAATLWSPGSETAVAAAIEQRLAGRTLLLIVENFDDILEQLGHDGQAKLRAHLQNHASWTILATAQGIRRDISDQTAPFYGFFEIEHLKDLTLDESRELLRALATRTGDAELAEALDRPLGRARVRALRELAGGNHRVHVIFSRFLTRTNLADFAEPFMRTLDELTPYYQERMRWLSPQQRKLVECICDAREPPSVKAIAAACRVTQNVAAAQLKVLRDLGYVTSREVGRESHYSLKEPLLRLVLDLKKHRGGALRSILLALSESDPAFVAPPSPVLEVLAATQSGGSARKPVKRSRRRT